VIRPHNPQFDFQRPSIQAFGLRVATIDCDYHVDMGDIEKIAGFVDEGLGNMHAWAL
jgi:hypothetical protein